MNWYNIIKTASKRFFYHGTSSFNLSTILTQGLNTNFPKRRVWNDEESVRNWDTSLASFPGTYFTPNLITAISSAWKANQKLKKKDVDINDIPRIIVMAELELRTPSIVPDEDNLSKPLDFISDILKGSLSDSLYILAPWIENGFPNIQTLAEKSLEYIFIKNKNSNRPYADEKFKRAKPFILPLYIEVIKNYAYLRLFLMFNRDQKYTSTNLQEMFPVFKSFIKTNTQSSLDTKYRQSFDIFLQKVNILTEISKDEEYLGNVRSKDPVGYRGSNHIVLVAEFIQHEVSDRYYSEIIVHYVSDNEALHRLIDETIVKIGNSVRVYDKQGNIYFDHPNENAKPVKEKELELV
jgi:hypothetical protein